MTLRDAKDCMRPRPVLAGPGDPQRLGGIRWGKVGSSYITAIRHLDLSPQIAVLRSYETASCSI